MGTAALGVRDRPLELRRARVRREPTQDKEAQAAQDPNSPASEARRLQFEETLKSLNLRSTARIRTSKEQPKNNDAEIGSNRSVPPPEYRDLYDAYTRSLAKQAPRQSDSKK